MTYQSLEWEGEIVAPHRPAQDPAPQHPVIPMHWLTLAVGASGAVVLGLMVQNRLAVSVHDGAFYALIALFAVLGTLRWRMHHAATPVRRRARDFADSALIFSAITVLGGIASYAAACDTRGFMDAALARGDAALHFNWLDWYETVVRHPVLQALGKTAYGSIYITPWVLIGAMTWQDQQARTRQFLATFWLGAVMTLALFPLFPAKGALDYLWQGPIPYMPTSGLYQGEIIPALRAHSFGLIQLGALRGLVCAPSFHTVCATLFIATALPMPRLRWIIVPINAAMLLATPVEGTHYLTDMLIGLAVALTALAIVRAGARWLHRGAVWG
jgi:hypothetical protein